MRKSEDISVLNGSAYEHFNDHIKRPYLESSRIPVARMQNAVMLIEGQIKGE